MAKDTITKTLTVAALLCIVCSVLVSTAAVKLKPLQERNKALSTKKKYSTSCRIDGGGKGY